MGNYISKFDTTAELAAFSATTSFIRPHVSLTKDDSKIHYFEDPYNGHEYVEIGGLKWATMNVGATGVTDYGLYFQWGDTSGYTADQVGSGSGQKPFNWSDTPYYTANTGSGSSGFTKYNTTDGKTVLELSDDAVQANWGGSWRMPTTDDFVALGNAIDYINARGDTIGSGYDKLTTLSGVTGLYVADKTDLSKRLFFPAGGCCYKGKMYSVDSGVGFYWSSSLYSSDVLTAYFFYPNRGGVKWQDIHWERCNGFSVRGVIG